MKVIKNVIAINGSPRNKNTYYLLQQLKEKLHKEDVTIEIINLSDYTINHCIGCQNCVKNKPCPLKDDVHSIIEKLKSADGILLSSPVYMSNISGKLKSFIDRTCYWFHRPELVGKPCMVLATTAGSDLKYVLKYLEKVCIEWGLHPSGQIGRSVKNLNESITPKEYKIFVSHLTLDKQCYRPSLKQLIIYQVQRVLANKVLEVDKLYWEKKGWSKKLFYYECCVHPLKRLLCILLYKILDHQIKKVDDTV